MIKIACSGFPVGRKKYETHFRTVELSALFNAFPRPSTIEKWSATAADGFEFVVCASKLITHPSKKTAAASTKTLAHRIGYFQDTAEVRQAFQRTWAAAETLKSKIVLFQCPAFFSPHADHVQRLQKFFQPIPRGNKHIVWEPPASWPLTLVESLSRSLYLTPSANPLAKNYKPTNSPMRYFRIGANGKTSGISHMSDLELQDIRAACDRPLSYVVFNNGPTAFADALRFRSLAHA